MEWLPFLIAGGLLTFATRLSFIVLLGRFEAPEVVTRALRYVPPAVLSAIIFPEVLLRDDALVTPWANPRLIAGVLAGIIAWRTRNVLLTIAVVLAVFWALGWAGM